MMHAVSCEDVQAQLEEFHDGELPVEQCVAIQGHLRDCVTCALVAAELEDVGHMLRQGAMALPTRTPAEAERLPVRVLERIRVEQQFSWASEIRTLFEDMHLVWAALGATAATLVCLAGSLSVLHAANQERPGSLAGIISYLANPGSNENPVRLHEWMAPPSSRPDLDAVMPVPADDSVLALSAVVTREGRVQNLSLLGSDRALNLKVRPDVLLAMLEAAAQMEFEPAKGTSGAPVAVSMVWVLASTTVKGHPIDDVMMVQRPAATGGGELTPGPTAPAAAPPVLRSTTDGGASSL